MGIYNREQSGKGFKAKLKVSEEKLVNIWNSGFCPILFSLLIYCIKENLNLLTINLQHLLTLSGLGFETSLRPGGGRFRPPLLTPLPCIRTKPSLVWANTII